MKVVYNTIKEHTKFPFARLLKCRGVFYCLIFVIMDWYTLSRQWFDFAFENPDKIKSEHTAIYFLACEQWNRFWQKEKFWFPSYFSMEVCWIKNHRTYQKYFDDLVKWWFIIIVQESLNQYSSCIIALVENDKALDKALDKANARHYTKQMQGTATIDKQLNKETKKQENNAFENFYKLYPKKVNRKDAEKKYEIKCKQDWEENIINWLNAWIQKWKIENKPEFIPAPDVWLNKEKYNDELWEIHPTDDELEDYKDTNQLWEKYDIVGKYRPAFLELRKKGITATEEERAQAYEIRKEFERTYNLI